jgi:hypothetical protein
MILLVQWNIGQANIGDISPKRRAVQKDGLWQLVNYNFEKHIFPYILDPNLLEDSQPLF